MQTLSKEKYEASRPSNEQKLIFEKFIVRAYVDQEGSLHVLAHRRNEAGHEGLPLAYMLGTNSLILD